MSKCLTEAGKNFVSFIFNKEGSLFFSQANDWHYSHSLEVPPPLHKLFDTDHLPFKELEPSSSYIPPTNFVQV